MRLCKTLLHGAGAFALVLALIEQVVLENLDDKVKTGGKVYEQDHVRHYA